MTRKEEMLAAFEDAWSYKWESLESVLDGITEEEAAYQHSVYSEAEREEGYPLAGTIMWHLVHLAHCYRHYANAIERRLTPHEELPVPNADSLAEAISNLKRYRAQLRNAIVSVPEDQLDDEVFGYDTVAHLVRLTVRHDAWHGSQIAVVKRMYRMR